ncbi:MAG: S41 family peptidase [Terriglobia bacterium]|jgi:C-terminal processing protease CtpA/Prc
MSAFFSTTKVRPLFIRLPFIVWVFGVTLTLLTSPTHAQTQPSFMDNFRKVMDRPGDLTRPLQQARLAKDLPSALESLPAMLRNSGIEVIPKTPGTEVRLGAKMVPVEGQVWWKHFEGAKQRPWIDVIEFKDEESAKRIFDQRGQWHSGAKFPDYFVFTTLRVPNGLDAVAAIVLRGRYLFNFGFGIPFKVRFADEGSNSPEELKYISESIDSLALVMEVVARDVVDPTYITWIPRGIVTDEERRILRMAAFARLWSEVKYNFVFLDRRPDLDWDSILELYLPRIAAAGSQEEYTEVLEEVVALLKDSHTQVFAGGFKDTPALNIEPIEGRPVVTTVGETPAILASGVLPGMELVAVNGVPVQEMLKKKIYPYIAASTPQDRGNRAFPRLLEGETDTRLSATFQDIEGKMHTVELSCDLSKHPEAAKWREKPPVEFRKLPPGITYVALNTFGSDEVAKEFDSHFDEVLNSKGLILDVRDNGGGSSENCYAIIARLIDKATSQTSKWRTRDYKPALRAWGKPEEWYEGEADAIQPRGEKPYLEPVVVLIGPKTLSAAEDFVVPLKATKRAILIGTATGGSTGQPLFIRIFGTSVMICTKWDRFPDGTEFVGEGIQPDISVQQTRRDIAEGKDPALARAVAFLANVR